MTSNLGTHAARDLARELARAYDGEVPPPYYWQIPSTPPRAHGRRHPGEMLTALPLAVAAGSVVFVVVLLLDYALWPAVVISGSLALGVGAACLLGISIPTLLLSALTQEGFPCLRSHCCSLLGPSRPSAAATP